MVEDCDIDYSSGNEEVHAPGLFGNLEEESAIHEAQSIPPGNSPLTSSTAISELETMEGRIRLLRGKTMAALSLMLGTSRIKSRQYGSVRAFINFYQKKSGGPSFPTYGTLHNSYYKTLRKYVFAQAGMAQVEVSVKRAGVKSAHRQSEFATGTAMDKY